MSKNNAELASDFLKGLSDAGFNVFIEKRHKKDELLFKEFLFVLPAGAAGGKDTKAHNFLAKLRAWLRKEDIPKTDKQSKNIFDAAVGMIERKDVLED